MKNFRIVMFVVNAVLRLVEVIVGAVKKEKKSDSEKTPERPANYRDIDEV